MQFSESLCRLAEVFHPTSLYVVGGAVRDSLRGIFNKDIDLAGKLKPDEVKTLLENSEFKVEDSAKKLGTLIIKSGNERYEYTTFRKDSYPEGSGQHKPCEVVFTDDINTDCKRRDFRCNAVYYDLRKREIVDPLDGIKDIKEQILQTTRAEDDVLKEDGLRIMRLMRFVSVLGFKPSDSVIEACKRQKDKLKDVSVERIRDELDKLLQGKNVFNALQLAYDTGVLEIILPEIAQNADIAQPPLYHKYDAMRHAFKCAEVAEKDIKLSALLHDVGKAFAINKDGNMHNHAIYGEVIAKGILDRYKYPNAVKEQTLRLIKEHMYDINNNARESKLRKFISKNYDIIDKLIALIRADSLATGIFEDSPRADRLKSTLQNMKDSGIPLKISELAINGNDLKEVGYKGIEIGDKLRELHTMCLEGRLKNDRQLLLKYLKNKHR